MTQTTSSIGYGAEYLVKSDLLFAGARTLTPDLPNAPYDILAEFAGGFKRIQVKARTADKFGRVRVDIRKSNGESRYYTKEDCDIIAIVEPVTRRIAYVPAEIWEGRAQISLHTEGAARTCEYSFDAFKIAN